MVRCAKKGDTQLKDTDTVAVDGAPLTYQKFVYLMLNKPEGVVSASTDKRDPHRGGSGRGTPTPGGSCSRQGGWIRPVPVLCC